MKVHGMSAVISSASLQSSSWPVSLPREKKSSKDEKFIITFCLEAKEGKREKLISRENRCSALLLEARRRKDIYILLHKFPVAPRDRNNLLPPPLTLGPEDKFAVLNSILSRGKFCLGMFRFTALPANFVKSKLAGTRSDIEIYEAKYLSFCFILIVAIVTRELLFQLTTYASGSDDAIATNTKHTGRDIFNFLFISAHASTSSPACLSTNHLRAPSTLITKLLIKSKLLHEHSWLEAEEQKAHAIR